VSDRPRDPRDEDLEELDDGVILAQETAVHSPQRRTNVATDSRSVVISEPPHQPREGRATVRTRRDASEKTVVIRDRRQLEKMRRAISDRQELKPRSRKVEPKTLYLLAVAAVGSLVVGTLIAALVDSQKSQPLPATSASGASKPRPPVAPDSSDAPETIDLDSLPLDKSRRHVSR
jgi:hypothetical protein